MRARVSHWCPALLAACAGSATAFGAGPYLHPLNLATVNGATPGVVFNGAAAVDQLGASCASAGDVNGDGFDDVIIAARDGDANGQINAGLIYVVFGKPTVTGLGTFNVSALNGTTGFVIRGIDLGDQSGWAVSSAGDLNNDHFNDILIGAPQGDPGGRADAGECYVVFGKSNIGASGSINLSTLNGTTGFVINGVLAGDNVGEAVTGGGDVNGDNIDDIVLGAPHADTGGSASGAVYIVFGSATVGAGGSVNLTALNGTNGRAFSGLASSDLAGSAVAVLKDVNADGVDDIMVGAPHEATGDASGDAWLLFGGPGIGTGTTLASPGPHGRCRFEGIGTTDHLGNRVASAGDINGDGFSDVLLTAPGTSALGKAYVLFGGPGFEAMDGYPLDSLDGANGFVILGTSASQGFGDSASAAGDLNADGFDDIILGSHYADPFGTFNAGEVYVVFGGPSVGASGSINLSAINGVTGFRMQGEESSDYAGYSVSSAGDLNGDGIDDVVLGAWFADPNSINRAGRAYLVFGKVGNTWISPSSGTWSTGSRWLGGVAPVAGTVIIHPTFGVTVTAPSSAAFLDSLTIDADFGRTTLDLGASSLVVVEDPFTIPTRGALSGDGVFACTGDEISNAGQISLDTLTIVGKVSNAQTGEITSAHGFIAGDVSSSGLIDLVPTAPATSASLDVDGMVTNNTVGMMLIRNGQVDLASSEEIRNSGQLDIALADATIFGTVLNFGVPLDEGYLPLGAINIIEESFAMFVDDVHNQSVITLDADSSLAILGTLFGNGISGPGGQGTAGAVFLGGGVSPGFSPGIAQFDGDVTLGATAITTIELGGTTPGTGHDKIVVAGVLGVSGTLRVTLMRNFVPQPLDVYDVLDFGSVIGTFSAIELDSELIAKGADTSTLLIDGKIRIPAPSCPGDVNGDGNTNVADFNILAGNFGEAVAPNTNGDLNGNGLVNVADFNILAGDFGCGS